MTAHRLAAILDDAADGRFPPFDGRVEVVPSPGPPCDALVAFTGHYVLAADVDAREIAARWPVGKLSEPFSPASLVWLSDRIGLEPLTHDVLLATLGDGSGAPPWLRRDDDLTHPRVEEAVALPFGREHLDDRGRERADGRSRAVPPLGGRLRGRAAVRGVPGSVAGSWPRPVA